MGALDLAGIAHDAVVSLFFPTRAISWGSR
jgi:hypothetical protein